MNVSLLKAHASRALKEIRENKMSFLIYDRDIPVARMVPYMDRDLVIRKPKKKFKLPKNPVLVDVDPLDFLLEDRKSR
ncbi:MAG: hypothetical protein L6Q54_11205 [Leptospiraceae bacterium]|nr:hypothetical protein [Leptospiraceae bacterium]MCK6381796.1 hypothetical protein [Leptospiraceae bacterium]NUM41704.1 hypothetical protein [Leptospiraceae bacterium]